MKDFHYTSERHIQILIDLLKTHNIRKVIASPGTTNLTFIGSIQSDPYFELYSSVDERSAAYLACGLSVESGEPVVLSCTGATASRNYIPGLTEAYYRKIPILAVTSTQHHGRIEQYIPQVIDRSEQINDTVYLSKQIYRINSEEDEWSTVVSINEALLELKHRGGGPVHINIETTYSKDFSVNILPSVREIYRIGYNDILPDVCNGKVAIFVGAHNPMPQKLIDNIELFCEKYGAVVLCDLTSNYTGKYRVYPSLVCSQDNYVSKCRSISLLIHIGSISGSDISMDSKSNYEVWRVNPDGKIRDTFRKLKYVFEMEEIDFFVKYNNICKNNDSPKLQYFNEWKNECERFEKKIGELPFSNVWIARNTINKLPKCSSVYFGILNTLRSWNYFNAPEDIIGYSNTGGFGIDGGLSTLIGASFCNPNRLYYCIIGDLSFFYDMNVLGNKHIGNNLRIMVINNGLGTEFTNYNHMGAAFGENAKPYIAASGHFGNKSRILLKHFAEDLGFDYYAASSKEEYFKIMEKFIDPSIGLNSCVFEIFTDSNFESDAVRYMRNLEHDLSVSAKGVVKKIIGEKKYDSLKKMIKK